MEAKNEAKREYSILNFEVTGDNVKVEAVISANFSKKRRTIKVQGEGSLKDVLELALRQVKLDLNASASNLAKSNASAQTGGKPSDSDIEAEYGKIMDRIEKNGLNFFDTSADDPKAKAVRNLMVLYNDPGTDKIVKDQLKKMLKDLGAL